ncbi:MAG TPA: hypothetical protein EYP57_02715 [Thermodesulfobacteriaceae bacterium]|nr:hypothetical protein [Thermodesulfobacteriaceae bacterium]
MFIYRVLFPCFLLILSSCSPEMYGWTNAGMDPVNVQLYVVPDSPAEIADQKVLVVPFTVQPHQNRDISLAVTELVREIFHQRHVFSVLDIAPELHISEERMVDMAADRGFDYLMVGNIPPVMAPAGNSSGWVAMEVKVIETRSRSEEWHIYGETALLPGNSRIYVLYDRPYESAPTVSRGFAALAGALADVMQEKRD